MNKSEISAIIKASVPRLDGKVVWSIAGAIWSAVNAWHKAELKKNVKAVETHEMDEHFQKFLDNPLPPEEESRRLRAILHADLSMGRVNPQMLDKIDKIIGINSGDDVEINCVDFSEAFPSLAEAIEICTKPKKIQGEEND